MSPIQRAELNNPLPHPKHQKCTVTPLPRPIRSPIQRHTYHI